MIKYSVRKITVGGFSQVFACKGFSHMVESDKLKAPYLFKKQLYAKLYKDGNYILKVCYSQSIPKDLFRKYILKSQAERESKSAEILSQLGLLVPKSYFRVFSLSPFAKGRIESMHEMDFLNGFEDLPPKFFAQRDDSTNIIECFGRDLARVTDAMYCPKDLGMGNVMYHKIDKKMAWIDTDLRKFKSKSKLSQSIMSQLRPRFLNRIDSQQSEVFWKVFCESSTLFPEKKELLSYGEIYYNQNQPAQGQHQKTQ